MLEMTVTIVNPLGLHGRPATKFVKLAEGYDAKIEVYKEGVRVEGKSIMGLLMLGAAKGETLTIRAEGPQAEQALRALAELIGQGFGDGEAQGTLPRP